MRPAEPLASWNDGPTKDAVLGFVERVTADGVPPEERIAVFDNDGTLWCEKPTPALRDGGRRPGAPREAEQGWTVVSVKGDWKTVFAS